MAPSLRIVTSMPWYRFQHWTESTEIVEPKRSTVLWLLRFVRAAAGADAVIVRGTVTLSDRYRDLLAAALVRRLRFRCRIVVSDATFEYGGNAVAAKVPIPLRAGVSRFLTSMSKALIRLIDGPNVVWCVLSRAEEKSFYVTWGIKHGTVRFTPFPFTVPRGDIEEVPPAHDERYFFSGGDSLRDYGMLAGAVRGTDLHVRVASRHWAPPSAMTNLDVGPCTESEFFDLMAESCAVVIPLQDSVRSAGQQTYLNAMAMGKVLIVNDAVGVTDYVEHGVTGLVVHNSLEMSSAMASILDESRSEELRMIASNARSHALERYSREVYQKLLLEIASQGT